MSDGRQFTDWNPRRSQDAFFMEKLQVTSEHDYRKQLQQNGTAYLKNEIRYFLNNATCQCGGNSCTLK